MLKIFFLLLAFSGATAFAQTPAAIESELLGHLADIAKYGSYGGEWDDDKVYAANDAVQEKLLRYGNRPDVLKFPFPRLRAEMFVATSKDGKFRVYSWDKQTGGTMRDFAAVFQYNLPAGKVAVIAENDGDDDSAGSFYPEIFQLAAGNRTIYLLTSTFIGSTSMHGQSIRTVEIERDKLNLSARLIKTASGLTSSIGFGYDFFSVVDRPERPIKLFEFNERRREFRFPVVLEDEKTPQGRVTNRSIAYRFNGRHFERIP
jgi:hypothetical protein